MAFPNFQFWLYTARFIDYERVKRMRVGNWVIIVSGNGLSPVGRQAITQINAILFSVGLDFPSSGSIMLLQIFHSVVYLTVRVKCKYPIDRM